MVEEEIPQVQQVRAWLDGELHPGHDVFSMGRGFAEALLAEIDTLRSVLVFADGFVVHATADDDYPMALADLYNETCDPAGAIRRAGCHERGKFRRDRAADRAPAEPPNCACRGMVTDPGFHHGVKECWA